MRRVLLTALLLVALPGMRAEAQSCNGCGIGYTPPAGAAGLTSSGTAITSTLPLLLPNGSATAGSVSLSFANDTDNGFFSTGGELFYANNTARIAFSQTQIRLNSTHALGWSSSTPGSAADTLLTRDAANTLALRNSTNAQQFNLYETYTDGSNYSRLSIQATAGAFKLLPAAAGTGTLRVVAIGDGGAKPTCAAATRGGIWYDAGGAGAADTLEVCRKDAGDAYAWVSLF